MTNPIDRCLRLAREAGIEGVTRGEHEGQPALFCDDKPFAVFVKNDEIDLTTTFEGGLQLMQSNPDVFRNPKGKPQGNAVRVDCSGVSDEELAIHLEQSCHCVS